MANPIYKALATAHQSFNNAIKSSNFVWSARWEDYIIQIMKNAPSGSGFDSGTKFMGYFDGKLKFSTAFHHMNDNGFYDGWTEHIVTVKPDLQFGYLLSVSGPNKNGIKEYIIDTFHEFLDKEVVPINQYLKGLEYVA